MCTNYPAAAFVIMVVTTVLLVPSSAAPTLHGSSSDAEIADSWWYNACGHHSILHPQNKKHHNRSDMQIFRIVKNQLKLFHDFFNQEFKHIEKMYPEVEQFNKVERKQFDWIPKYTEPTSKIRSKTALKDFHKDLQYYVVAVNYLGKLKIHSEVQFNWAERNETLVKVFNNLKSLICEVEAGVNATGQTVANRVPPNYPLQRGLVTDFENLTEMYLHDTGVMVKLKDFIKKWNNKMKRLLPNHKRESESDDSDTMEITDNPEEMENSIFE